MRGTSAGHLGRAVRAWTGFRPQQIQGLGCGSSARFNPEGHARLATMPPPRNGQRRGTKSNASGPSAQHCLLRMPCLGLDPRPAAAVDLTGFGRRGEDGRVEMRQKDASQHPPVVRAKVRRPLLQSRSNASQPRKHQQHHMDRDKADPTQGREVQAPAEQLVSLRVHKQKRGLSPDLFNRAGALHAVWQALWNRALSAARRCHACRPCSCIGRG